MKLLPFVGQAALATAVVVFFSVTTNAITVQEVPGLRPNSWVNDSIDILSPETETQINRVIDQLEAKNRCEIMVITVPETKGYSSPRDFALTWFNHWTVGKKGLNNGVLLMYSRGDDRADQTPRDRIEIVTGWGVREILPDQEVVSLIQRELRPRVNEREYDAAMLTGTQSIAAVLQKYQPKPTTSSDSSKSPIKPTTSNASPKHPLQVVVEVFFQWVFLTLVFGLVFAIPSIVVLYVFIVAIAWICMTFGGQSSGRRGGYTGGATTGGSTGYSGGATTGGSTGGSTGGGGGGSSGGGGGGSGGGGGGG